MTSLAVDGIHLAFDESWTVMKWDDCPSYVNGIMRLNGSLEGRGARLLFRHGPAHDDDATRDCCAFGRRCC